MRSPSFVILNEGVVNEFVAVAMDVSFSHTVTFDQNRAVHSANVAVGLCSSNLAFNPLGSLPKNGQAKRAVLASPVRAGSAL